MAKQASSRTHGMVHDVAPMVMQASAQGFCVQKIQLKNNYQKISASPVRLYCLNRCFLFIWCNNRMLFLIKKKKRKQMKTEKRKKKGKKANPPQYTLSEDKVCLMCSKIKYIFFDLTN